MDSMSRREMCVALSVLMVMAATKGEAQKAMTVPPPPGSAGDPVLSASRAFTFDSLPVVKTEVGESRAVTRGLLPTGEAIEMHETTLRPGFMPHPPHRHRHTEFVMLREGTLEFDNDGKMERVGPGGVLFSASDQLHGMKNVGQVDAKYFVISIGRDSPAVKV